MPTVSPCVSFARNSSRLLLPLLLLAAPVSAQVVPDQGVTDYQVIQRARNGRARLEFSGSTTFRGPASLEGTVVRAGQVGVLIDWKAVGSTNAGRFEARIPDLEAGGPYDVHLRVVSKGQVVDVGVIRNIHVGDLWVLAGQSNMEGMGALSNVETPSRQVHVFDMADRWLVAEEPLHWLEESVDSVHSGSEGGATRSSAARRRRREGAGLGLPFAKEMVARTGVPVGLIPCAHGGTSMADWDSELASEGGASLYGSMMRRINACGGQVAGVLWYQGESDANQESARDYERNLRRFVRDLRVGLNERQLPFYYVQLGRVLGPDSQNEGWTQVRTAQLRAEASLQPPVGMVCAIDLPLGDSIHLSTHALQVLGRRLSLRACRDLVVEESVLPGPRPTLVRTEPGGPGRVIVTYSGVNGMLVSEGWLSGFSIRDGNGEDLNLIVDQYTESRRPNDVVLELAVGPDEVPDGAQLFYGYGTNPYCNLRDRAGFAAPAFGPRKIPKPGR